MLLEVCEPQTLCPQEPQPNPPPPPEVLTGMLTHPHPRTSGAPLPRPSSSLSLPISTLSPPPSPHPFPLSLPDALAPFVPNHLPPSLVPPQAVLTEQLAPILVKGYRPGQGVDAERWPTSEACAQVAAIAMGLRQSNPRETAFSKYSRGEISLDQYFDDLRDKLSNQGGAWVTVAPRDTCQQVLLCSCCI